MRYYFGYVTNYLCYQSLLPVLGRLLKGNTWHAGWIIALAAFSFVQLFDFLLSCGKREPKPTRQKGPSQKEKQRGKKKIPGENHLPELLLLERVSCQRSALKAMVTGCPQTPAMPCGLEV